MSDVTYSKEGRIGVITFDRPKANAFDLVFHEEFGEAITIAGEDGATRIVVICSAVDGFFCTGADIQVFSANDKETNQKMADAARNNLAAIESSGKLFIAAINGHALGGGLEIALGCDMRLGAKGDYQLGLPEVRLGLTPGNGGTQRLARMVGPSKALELCVSGQSFGPKEAFDLGLLNRLFPARGFEAHVQGFAEELATRAPLAVAALKRGIRAGIELPLSESLKLEETLVDALYDTEDAAESLRALSEKRAAVYRGR